jgi:AcrR family transcriptional regulator
MIHDTRERILDAALRVFAEAGALGATTRRIATEAGVNEVTLFRHFGTKEVLLREALARASRQAELIRLPAEPSDPAAELSAWCRVHLRALFHVRALLRTSMGEFEANPEVSQEGCRVAERVSADLARYLERLQARGLADPGVDPHTAAALLMGAVFSDALTRDIQPERYPLPPDEAAVQYAALFLRALGVTPQPAVP